MEKSGMRLLVFSLLVGAAFVCIYPALRSAETASAGLVRTEGVRVVVDAGHGGEDGGAVSVSGERESEINLAIALRLRDLLALAGVEPVMIRTDDSAVYSDGCTGISQKKLSDLQNRVRMTQEAAPALLLSIHQNFFEQAKYRGAQVFFAKTEGSRALAEKLQNVLCASVDPSNHRQIKPAQTVYLMEHAPCTAALIECGFLSNAAEEQLLRTPDYQKKLAAAICAASVEYLSEREDANEVKNNVLL